MATAAVTKPAIQARRRLPVTLVPHYLDRSLRTKASRSIVYKDQPNPDIFVSMLAAEKVPLDSGRRTAAHPLTAIRRGRPVSKP